MKNIKNTFLTLIVLFSLPAISMEAPPKPMEVIPAQASLDTLPPDVKRLLVPLIASSKVAEVADTILALNRTNKFFNNYLKDPANLIAILERMPYTANATDLIENYLSKTNIPVVKNPQIEVWRKGIKLEKGNELYQAVTGITHPSNVVYVKNILRNPNIELNWKNPRFFNRAPLASAAVFGNVSEVELLLAAGANPNFINRDGRSTLWEASYNGHKTIVEKLLQAGATVDEETIYWTKRRPYPDIVEILQKAFAQQQKDKEQKLGTLQKRYNNSFYDPQAKNL